MTKLAGGETQAGGAAQETPVAVETKPLVGEVLEGKASHRFLMTQVLLITTSKGS